jgi:hypothetical protein
MTMLRPYSLLLVPLLAGCGLDSGPREVVHSPGFFSEFDLMVDNTMARGTNEERTTKFKNEFIRRVNDGPQSNELYVVGNTWDKVRAFLDIGIVAGEVLEGVNDSAQSRVDVHRDAADWVLRSDYSAITLHNSWVSDEDLIRPTGEIVWESLHLLLTESAHAQRKVSTVKGQWVEGHWTRGEGSRQSFWMKDYIETIWHDGVCHDQLVGTECTSVWIDSSCSDVLVDDGYWESTCSEYDDTGDCVGWTDTWVDTSYYETVCSDGYYQEQCTDIYQTVCEQGHWEDRTIAAQTMENIWVPGEPKWVDGYEAKKAEERIEVLPAEEAMILALGMEYVLSYGPGYLSPTCQAKLEAAHSAYPSLAPEISVKTSRGAILYCLSKN